MNTIHRRVQFTTTAKLCLFQGYFHSRLRTQQDEMQHPPTNSIKIYLIYKLRYENPIRLRH